jgi:hypothetical protein
MNKTALEHAVQWRMEKKANIGSEMLTMAANPLETFRGLDDDQKRKVLMMLAGGAIGGGAGYLGGKLITKDKDSTGWRLGKQIGGGVLGAGAGALAGGVGSMGYGALKDLYDSPITTPAKIGGKALAGTVNYLAS